jgi:2-desacetyl-2-hydroxyethyl bacteriochlorophyllide A dehydrogenase
MRAAVLEDWKKIVVTEIEAPVLQDGEALLRVKCAAVCGSDVHIFNGDNPIAITPVIQGHEFMGEVVKIADGSSTGCSVGSRVVVQPLISCGYCTACLSGQPHVCESLIVIGVNQNGGFAEYARVPTDTLFEVPADMPDEVAVLSEPFSIGYHACSRGNLQPGQRTLVIGAGPIGLYSAIVAREMGASDVVISEPLAERRALAENCGFAVFGSLDGGLLEALKMRSNGEGYDMIIETSGVEAGIACAVEAAAVRGNIVSLGFPAKEYAPYNVTRGIIKELSFIGSRVCPREEFHSTLTLLDTLHKRGEVDLDGIVSAPRSLERLAQSISNVESGKECSKILITPV